MNADGTNQLRLTNNVLLEATPTWSPDGQQIVFHRQRPGGFELFTINADGTGETQLTDTPGLNAFARWGVTREPCEGDESD
jgi:Tol biopolymer transport system component